MSLRFKSVNLLLGMGGTLSPSGVIIHATAGASALSSFQWLSKIGLGYHYIIDRNGDVWNGVPRTRKAFHAGISRGWAGRGCNNYTIGIAFANRDNGKEPITEAQEEALRLLLMELKRKEPNLKYLSCHKWVSRGRKFDPVSWTPQGLTFQGLTIWRGDA